MRHLHPDVQRENDILTLQYEIMAKLIGLRGSLDADQVADESMNDWLFRSWKDIRPHVERIAELLEELRRAETWK